MAQENIKLSPEIEQLSEKLQADPKSRVFAQLADAYRKANLLDEAIDTAKKGLEVHPKYAIAHLVLGRCYLSKGMFALAREEFDLTIKNDPQNLVGYKLLGETYEKQNMYPDALKYYQLVMDLEPGNAELAEKIERLKGLKQGEPPAEPEPAPQPAPEPVPAVQEKTVVPTAAGELVDSPAPAEEAPPTENAVPETAEPAPAFDLPAMPEVLQEELPKPEAEAAPPVGIAAQEAEPQIPPSSEETPPAPEPTSEPAADALPAVLAGPAEVESAASEQAQGPTSTLAEIYAQQGFYEKAIDIYKELIAAHPEDQGYKDRMEDMIAKAYPDEPAEPPAPTEPVALPQQAEEPKAPADAVLPETAIKEPAPGEGKSEPAPGDDPFAQMFAPMESAPTEPVAESLAQPSPSAPEELMPAAAEINQSSPVVAEPQPQVPSESPAVDFGALFTDVATAPAKAEDAAVQPAAKPEEKQPTGEDTVSSFQAWLSQIQK